MGVGDGRTYGKGLVQNIAELPFNNALKYTVAKYYTPSGRSGPACGCFPPRLLARLGV